MTAPDGSLTKPAIEPLAACDQSKAGNPIMTTTKLTAIARSIYFFRLYSRFTRLEPFSLIYFFRITSKFDGWSGKQNGQICTAALAPGIRFDPIFLFRRAIPL